MSYFYNPYYNHIVKYLSMITLEYVMPGKRDEVSPLSRDVPFIRQEKCFELSTRMHFFGFSYIHVKGIDILAHCVNNMVRKLQRVD